MAAGTVTALYLAHLNPVTNAHVEIISDLQGGADSVKVMPVVFRAEDMSEVNSRSFPFSYECRRDMLRSVFGDSIVISDDYTFYAPFKRYMPPLLSPMSWRLRKQVLRGVDGRYFSYTGDKTEGYMLRLYGLKPRVGRRRPLSATSVKDKLYGSAAAKTGGGGDGGGMTGPGAGARDWERDVPGPVVAIIRENWDTIRRFADAPDTTARIAGMKFPKES